MTASEANRRLERAVREEQSLRDALFDEINSLAGGQSLQDLILEAGRCARGLILGALADLRDDPLSAPAWATSLAQIPVVQVDWDALGELFLLEIGTSGTIKDA